MNLIRYVTNGQYNAGLSGWDSALQPMLVESSRQSEATLLSDSLSTKLFVVLSCMYVMTFFDSFYFCLAYKFACD